MNAVITRAQARGRAIRLVRVWRGLSSEGLADAVGLSRSQLSRCEHGEYEAPITVLDRVATVLEVSAWRLLWLADQLLADRDPFGAAIADSASDAPSPFAGTGPRAADRGCQRPKGAENGDFCGRVG